MDNQTPEPYLETPPSGPRIKILSPKAMAPLHWVKSGWSDLVSAWPTALFYGICFWVMALVLRLIFQNQPEYTMSIASGCLLIGPFLAMGLYEVSRRRQEGLTNNLLQSLICWRPHIKSMGMLVLVFMVLELLWGRASLVVFAVFFNTGMPSTMGVMEAIFNPSNFDFLIAYILVGGVFALLVFSISAVSIPFIRDKDVDAITAAITSVRVVLGNSGVMILWGALLTCIIGGALVTPWSIGLIVASPLMGHASWHAYRDTVGWEDVSPQPTETR